MESFRRVGGICGGIILEGNFVLFSEEVIGGRGSFFGWIECILVGRVGLGVVVLLGGCSIIGLGIIC